MKNLKLKTLILSSLVATATIAPNLTSCSSKSTVKVEGATIDTSKSHIEVNRDSTIYLVPEKDSKITGIKSITVGETLLTRMAYKIEYEQANSMACKLTIFAKSMTSINIAIEVFTSDIEINEVNYNGDTLTTFAVLNAYNLEVRAKYKGVKGDAQLAAGEYLVFDDNKDITKQVLSSDGYKMNVAKTYNLTIKAAIDTSKTKEKTIEITDPYKEACEGVEYDPSDPRQHLECKAKIKESAKTLTGKITIENFLNSGGTSKRVTGIEKSGFAGSQATQFEFLDDCKITEIGEEAFKTCSKLQSYIVTSLVKTIGKDAFADCTELKTIYIDSQDIVNLTDDSSKLFTNAETIYIKNSLTEPVAGMWIKDHYTSGTPGDKYTPWTKNR